MLSDPILQRFAIEQEAFFGFIMIPNETLS